MGEVVKIERRYCGPPFSAHGGVAVGRFAAMVGDGPAEVRLLGPPPLDEELRSRRDEDGVIVVSGPGGDVARVRRLELPVEVASFPLVSDRALDEAAEAYRENVVEPGHPFPTCFGCGPDREPGDGLRQFTGPVGDGTTSAARFRVEGHGSLPRWMGWAGLDCPSGHTVGAVGEGGPEAAVLGTMSGQVGEVSAGVSYQVRGRRIASEGRKHTTEVAMLDPDGAVVAAARAIWIAVDPATIRPV